MRLTSDTCWSDTWEPNPTTFDFPAGGSFLRGDGGGRWGVNGGSQAQALPGQLMAVPPGPRALQHVQVSSSAKIGHWGADGLSLAGGDVCEGIVKGGKSEKEEEGAGKRRSEGRKREGTAEESLKGSEGKRVRIENCEGSRRRCRDGGQEEEQPAQPSKGSRSSWAQGGEEKGTCGCHSFWEVSTLGGISWDWIWSWTLWGLNPARILKFISEYISIEITTSTKGLENFDMPIELLLNISLGLFCLPKIFYARALSR